MSTFFPEEPPGSATRPEPVYRDARGWGPPNGVLAGVVAVEAVVARSETVVIALESLHA